MSQLKPGVKYIYERVDDITYAREPGSDERIELGYNYDPRTSDGRPLRDHMQDNKMWGEIRRMAPDHPALQDALDRAIVIYRLIKEERKDDPLFWHPV